MRPVDNSSSSTALPGLWSELNKRERERLIKAVQADTSLPASAKEYPGLYVVHHADQFLPDIKLSDLTPGAQKRVKAARAKGADLQTAITQEATRRFTQRYRTAQKNVDQAIKTVAKSDPTLA